MSGPLGGQPGAAPRAGKGQSKRRMHLKGLRMGSYVLISYREKRPGHLDEKVDYEGTLVDKRVGWENRESYVELKDCLQLNDRGEIVAREDKKRLIDAFIEDCDIIEKVERPLSPELAKAEGAGGFSPLGVALFEAAVKGTSVDGGSCSSATGMMPMAAMGMGGMMPMAMAGGVPMAMAGMQAGMPTGMQAGVPTGMPCGMPMAMGMGMPMTMVPMGMSAGMPMGMAMPMGMTPMSMGGMIPMQMPTMGMATPMGAAAIGGEAGTQALATPGTAAGGMTPMVPSSGSMPAVAAAGQQSLPAGGLQPQLVAAPAAGVPNLSSAGAPAGMPAGVLPNGGMPMAGVPVVARSRSRSRGR